jgi:hypothetical protein
MQDLHAVHAISWAELFGRIAPRLRCDADEQGEAERT